MGSECPVKTAPTKHLPTDNKDNQSLNPDISVDDPDFFSKRRFWSLNLFLNVPQNVVRTCLVIMQDCYL